MGENCKCAKSQMRSDYVVGLGRNRRIGTICLRVTKFEERSHNYD